MVKKIIAILLLVVLLFSCYSKNREFSIPAVYVNASKPDFIHRNGSTLLNQQPFSGWQYSLFANGDTASLTPFLDGKESGIAKQWYSRYQLEQISFYEDGKRSGEHRGWWENGQLKFIHHYAHDLFDGNQKEWYPDGKPYKELNYSAGYEKGLQKIWRPDGRLHANYEVRNGRNYGLTGTMHCKNIWKDGM
jgi:antitoxin component YwqK of YwqJK toxin-antitoxin module